MFWSMETTMGPHGHRWKGPTEGKDVILEIDMQGLGRLRNGFPGVFLGIAYSIPEQRRRIEKRGTENTDILDRLGKVRKN